MKKHKKTDYHDFTTIDMPAEERGKLMVGDIWENKAQCLECGDTIRSVNLHDFVRCSCGNLSVDGGSWYTKRMAKDFNKVKDLSVSFKNVDHE